jgi:hypothetical protein
VTRGGGGSGCAGIRAPGTATPSQQKAGGTGGGGAGGGSSSGTQIGGDGSTNFGGGGGGGGFYPSTPGPGGLVGKGGNGGSGVVIIKYADTYPAASETTGSPTITVSGGFRVYVFNASGSITF